MAALVLLGVGLVGGALRPALGVRDWGLVVLLGLTGNTLFHVLIVTGIHRTSPSHAALLVSLSPIFAAVLAGMLLGERLTARQLAGIGLALVGVALIVTRGRDGTATWQGDLLSLGTGLSWALYTVIGKPVLARATPLAVTTWAAVIGTVPLLPLGLPGLAEVQWGSISLGRWLLLIYLSAGTIALANLLWYWALARAATVRVAAFSYLIPVVATLIAAGTGQEALTASLALGAAAVLGGVALAQRA